MLHRKIEGYLEGHLKSENDRILILEGARPVSYTHLDVYKRQTLRCMSTLYSHFATLAAVAFAGASLLVGCGGSGGDQKDEPDEPSVDKVAFARGADVTSGVHYHASQNHHGQDLRWLRRRVA